MARRAVARLPLALAMLAALAGCDLAPHYARPGAPVPPKFPSDGAYQKAIESQPPPASVDWHQLFTDPKLAQVIELALANGRDLRIAAANVAAARATYRVQRSDLFPEIDAGAVARIAHSNNGESSATAVSGTGAGTTGSGAGSGAGSGTGNGTGGSSGTGTGTTAVATGGGTSHYYSLDLGIASYEIDLFGRVRNLTKSAFEQYLATDAGARATKLTLIGETAAAWYTFAADRSVLEVAQQTLKASQASAEVSRQRFEGGIASELDLQSTLTLVEQAQSDIAADMSQVAQDKNALDLLVGAPVSDDLLPVDIDHVTLPVELPSGLSSTILLRRPDVVEAEHQLIAANARIGAARAAFFPRISLTTAAGLASGGLSSLFTGHAFNWSVEPSATLPIFDGGANAGNLAYAKAERKLYLAQYEQAVQTAFREVADALARRGTIDAQLAAQQALTNSARLSLNLAQARYQGGIDPYLNYLDAERTLYTAQQSLAATKLIQAENLVTLYRVLGGDQNF
ncbi:MAG: efflux transporter outer membrane subunit [Sphingomonadaceae bacterium]|nr:efflux transporter outer membrane subunit [Sphingomonadaceae bacterium]